VIFTRKSKKVCKSVCKSKHVCPRVICHMSCVMCHVSLFSSSFFGQSGEAYQWRVCVIFTSLIVGFSGLLTFESSLGVVLQQFLHCVRHRDHWSDKSDGPDRFGQYVDQSDRSDSFTMLEARLKFEMRGYSVQWTQQTLPTV
jgi:hypothetical protein